MLERAYDALGQLISQPTVLTLSVRPIDAIAALFVVLALRAFLVPQKRRRDTEPASALQYVFLPFTALIDLGAWIIGSVAEDVIIRVLESERIQRSFVSASCAVLQSSKFRGSFQEFLESEHVKESCARVVQVVAESDEVAKGIHCGALNTGMIAALGVARQVPLVGRFVPPAESKESPLSPRVPPPQAFVDLPTTSARFRGRSADPRDRGFSSLSASTKASSSQASSSDD
jgi:hypothetical protein